MLNKNNEVEMLNLTKVALPLFGLFFCSTNAQSSMQDKDRSKIPDQYKWNLEDLYSSDEAWEQAREKLILTLPEVEKFKGSLGTSATNLLNCLELVSNISKEFSKLYTYASLSFDQDTRDQRYLKLQQEMDQLGAELGTKTAYIEPEILTIEPEKIHEFLK